MMGLLTLDESGQALEPISNSPAEFKQFFATEIERAGALVKISGAKVE